MNKDETLVNLSFNEIEQTNCNQREQRQRNENSQHSNLLTIDDDSSPSSVSSVVNQQQQSITSRVHHHQQQQTQNQFPSIDDPIEYQFHDCNVPSIASITSTQPNSQFVDNSAHRLSLISLSSNSSVATEDTKAFGTKPLSHETDAALEVSMDSRESQPLLGREAHEYFHNNFPGKCW